MGNPVAKVGFRVEHHFWLLVNLEPAGIEKSIGAGIWNVPAALIRGARLAQDHAGYPLYVKRETLKEFDKPPISGADALKAAMAIIDPYSRNHPRSKMRKADFLEAVREVDDRISKSIAQRLWKKHAPAEWRRAGTKSGSNQPR